MSSIPTLVAARRDDLVVQELPDEVLVYDLKTQQAHCLNQTAAFVWNHCDGKTPPLEIAARMEKQWPKPVGEEAVWIALKQLSQANLLQQPVVAPLGVTRRSAMRRIGLAAAVALPLVTTVIAPTAAMAATGMVPRCALTVSNRLLETVRWFAQLLVMGASQVAVSATDPVVDKATIMAVGHVLPVVI